MKRATLLLLIAFSGCGEGVRDDHFANDVQPARIEPDPVRPASVPVRIGELGANFSACGSAGTTRHLDGGAGATLPVRTAPFETVAESGAVPAGARFFVCSRSHDQRWLGIVYEEGGTLSPACGVSGPITSPRNYSGPCRSGWVPSAFVKLVAA